MGRFGAMMDGEWCGVDGCPMNVQRERERMMSKSGRVKRSNKTKKKKRLHETFRFGINSVCDTDLVPSEGYRIRS